MTLQQEYREKYEEGLERGRIEGIASTVTILRKLNLNDDQIVSQIMEQYHLSEGEAKSFLQKGDIKQ